MPRRTAHGHHRHEQGNRPTREAFADRQNPLEIYQDLETGFTVYIGRRGRTHLFTHDGKHHTSFHTNERGRARRVRLGRWIRVK